MCISRIFPLVQQLLSTIHCKNAIILRVIYTVDCPPRPASFFLSISEAQSTTRTSPKVQRAEMAKTAIR